MREIKPQPLSACGEYLCVLAEIAGSAWRAPPREYCDFGLVSFRFRVIGGEHEGELFDIALEIDHCDDGARLEELASAIGIEDRSHIEEDLDGLFGKPVIISVWKLEAGGGYPIATRWGCLSTEEVVHFRRPEMIPIDRPPCGKYPVKIAAADFDGKCLVLEFRIMSGYWSIGSGPWKGGILKLALDVVSRDKRLEEAERRKLNRILRIIDIEMLDDTDQMLGKAFILFVWSYQPWRMHDIASFGCARLEDGHSFDGPGHGVPAFPTRPTGAGGGPQAA